VGPLKEDGLVRAAAHITGGGIPDNLPRVLPAGVGAEVDAGSWPEPPLFDLIRRAGRVSEGEMRRTFNLGVGMILVVAAGDADAVLARLTPSGPAWVIGRCVPGHGVRYVER